MNENALFFVGRRCTLSCSSFVDRLGLKPYQRGSLKCAYIGKGNKVQIKLYERERLTQHNQTIHAQCRAYLDSSPLPPSRASQRQMSLSNTEFQEAEDIGRQRRRAQNVRELTACFRVLIIGRSNAGKTTILQRVCNTTEQPKIFNQKGHKVFHILV